MQNLALFTIALFSASLVAQDFVVTNVTLFDGEVLIENTSVSIEDGKVLEVAQTIETAAERIDGTGKFLMPGLTNSHVHAFSALSLKEAAKAGVLQMYDMHGMEQYQRQMQKSFKENPDYADFYFAGNAATVPNGHGTQFGFEVSTLTKPTEAQKFVADRISSGANYIKIIVEPWKETLNQETISALIAEAHANKIPAVVHISKWEDAKYVIEEKADGLVHIWWNKKVNLAELKKLATTENFFVIPTILTTHLALDGIRKKSPENEFLSNEDILREVRKLYDAGIPLLTGTDPPNAGINYGTDLYREMDLMSKAGIPNLEILKAATSNPSIYFNINETGYIREGYKAHMILLDKNPIQNIKYISTINTVWKSGKKVNRE